MIVLPDITFQQLLLRAGGVLVLSLVHGLALVLLSRALGHRGPQYDGRLTANPFQHIDALGAAVLVLFSYGWARNVEVDELSPARRILVAFGSLVAVAFVAVLIGATTYRMGLAFPGPAAATLGSFTRIFLEMVAGFVALNWLPVLPLSAGLVMGAVSLRAEKWVRRHQMTISLLLAATIVFGISPAILDPLRRVLAGLLLGAVFG